MFCGLFIWVWLLTGIVGSCCQDALMEKGLTHFRKIRHGEGTKLGGNTKASSQAISQKVKLWEKSLRIAENYLQSGITKTIFGECYQMISKSHELSPMGNFLPELKIQPTNLNICSSFIRRPSFQQVIHFKRQILLNEKAIFANLPTHNAHFTLKIPFT